MASWSLSLGIIDILQKNWVWVVINFALALGGYSFAISIFRRGHDNSEWAVQRANEQNAIARERAEAA